MNLATMDNSDSAIKARFEAAAALQNSGQFGPAQLAYESIIADCPGHAEAMHNLGLLFIMQGQVAPAAEWMRRAVEVSPNHPVYLSNYGNILQELQRWGEAVPLYQRALEREPNYADANYNLGNALQKIGEYKLAVESYHRAIALNPLWAEAYLNCGNSCDMLGRYEEALANFDKVIECNPHFSGGYINRSNVLAKLGRQAEALRGYDLAATLGQDAYQAYLASAELLIGQSQFHQSISKCQLAIKLKPLEAQPYYLMGLAAFQVRNLSIAIPSFQRAIELSPRSASAHNGLGLSLVKSGRFAEGRDSFAKALEIDPSMAIARVNIADSYFTQGDVKSALENFQLLDPGLQPLGLMQFFKLQMGDWSDYEKEKDIFLGRIRAVRLMGYTEDPWHLQRISDSAELGKEVAQNFFRTAVARAGVALPPITKRPKKEKIRIAYFSPDFRDHAVSHLALELFDSHSRDKFETYAFSFGFISPTDNMRPKLAKAFDHFIDINPKNDIDVAQMARELEIDIAFDLAGITSEARAGIFINRAAPIQVNFLGFTGTLGTDCHDYIIADEVVIPDDARQHYTEKVVQLPCMMPYDTRHDLSEIIVTREQAGLPAEGFIFSSYNQAFKFTPEVFDSWMRILKRTPGSYLWLSGLREVAQVNIRKEAQKRGVDPARIIFAARVTGMTNHLARLQCADLFLDTFPYNAHTSAIDSLWAGVPLITRMGQSFASRLAGSLLCSLGLADLIVASPEAYEELAIKLATSPEEMKKLRMRLAENKKTHGLFDMKLYRKNFEKALIEMYDNYHAGLPCRDMKIS